MPAVYPSQAIKHRLLKPLNGRYIPYTWLFTDTETHLEKTEGACSHHFTLGWTCLWLRSQAKGKDHYDWTFFNDELTYNQYLSFLAFRLGDLLIVGHNIFFDLQAAGFYDYFTRWGWNLKFYYDKGLTYILKCTNGRGKITVVSSTNWFDFSLEKLGESLGYHKLKIDFDTATPEMLKSYCRRDVEILVRGIRVYIDFITDNDLGKFSLTKASQAFTSYRYRFMPRKIYLHDNDYAVDLERAAYIGGRTECFHLGNISGGPFVSLDVNSMYPFVMKKHLYPYRLLSYYEDPTLEFIAERLSHFAVIAEVEVDTHEPVFAVKQKGKTIFPVGIFDCVVCSSGFKYGFGKGYINRVKRAAIYRQGDLFTGYVDFFSHLRQRYKTGGNNVMELLCKYMHNSLYGKFGQLKIVSDMEDEDTGRAYFREDVPNMVTGHTVVITHLMNRRITQYPEGEGENAFCAIAAHITENARFYLWEMIKKAGYDNVLYCDTDSIKIRSRDMHNVSELINPEKIGMLKVEDTSETLILEGPKNYRTENYRKIKGIPKKAVEIRPGVFQFESFVRQVTHLREGHIRGVRVKQITRRLRSPYDKGVVTPSGRVIPFSFPLPG